MWGTNHLELTYGFRLWKVTRAAGRWLIWDNAWVRNRFHMFSNVFTFWVPFLACHTPHFRTLNMGRCEISTRILTRITKCKFLGSNSVWRMFEGFNQLFPIQGGVRQGYLLNPFKPHRGHTWLGCVFTIASAKSTAQNVWKTSPRSHWVLSSIINMLTGNSFCDRPVSMAKRTLSCHWVVCWAVGVHKV